MSFSRPVRPDFVDVIAIVGLFSTFLFLFGCNSVPPPVTANMAVTTAEVKNAAAVGGGELAPVEMRSAREKLAQANVALAAHDYQAASDYAAQAQADAQLVQTKVSSTKAQQTATALQEDIRVLREELDRANNSKR